MLESETVWTVTDSEGSYATVKIVNSDDGPTLKIHQGEDHMVWLDASATPDIIKALQSAYAEHTGALQP